MRIRRKFISYIYISIVLLAAILVLMIFADPTEKILPTLPFTFTHLFIILFFLFIGTFFTFFVKKARVGMLISVFVTGIVILKLLDLTKPPYILLLLIVVAGTELYFRTKKNIKS